MIITLRQFAISLLVLLHFATAFAAPETPVVPLLLSEEVDEKNGLIPLPKETTAIIQYLEATIDLHFELRRYPWKRALEQAKNGEGLIFGISKTTDRLRKYAFSEPVYIDQTWLVTRCDTTFTFNDLQDLKGKTIGVVRGASSGEAFDQLANVLFKIEDDTGANQARFTKLYNRRMNALIFYKPDMVAGKLEVELNRQYAHHFTDVKKNDAHVFCVLPKPVSAVSIHFAAGIDQDLTYLELIDKALIRAKKNGDLQRIFSKDIQIEK
ncbi:MAG: ABC transporter substrate-binding protein [Pseudomonadota bacterium]